MAREQGYTQKELASEICVSTATVSDWLNGIAQPNKQSLDALASSLDCEPEEIMTDISGVTIGTNDREILYVHNTITYDSITYVASTINFGKDNPIPDSQQGDNTDSKAFLGIRLDKDLLYKLEKHGNGKVNKAVEEILKKYLDDESNIT